MAEATSTAEEAGDEEASEAMIGAEEEVEIKFFCLEVFEKPLICLFKKRSYAKLFNGVLVLSRNTLKSLNIQLNFNGWYLWFRKVLPGR